ncbi:MAG: efflux RND transporter periplasmic adaptor subunit [Xanthobacteraceae bacterium]
MNKRSVALIAGAALALGATNAVAADARSAPAKEPSVIVRVARAANGCFSDTIRVTGLLLPRDLALVTLDVPGYRISDVLAAEGDHVKAGQELVRLARVSGDGPGAPNANDPAAAQARLPAVVALRAPAAGLVTRVAAVAGAVASPDADPLFQIMTNDELELQVDVPSIHVPKLRADGNQIARVQVDNGTQVNGHVRTVPAEIERATQLGRARVSIDRAPGLRVGMFARAAIDASNSCGIAVPRGAVSYEGDGTTVQVVRDGKVETRPVNIGLLSDANVEIRQGLKEGELVVANAGGSLHDGDHVKTVLVDQVDR